MTSHDVVARVRRILKVRGVGHAGTLDPFATGLLVLAVGRATRLLRFLNRYSKRYRAVAVVGVTTDTDDRTGRVISETRPTDWPTRGEVEAVLGTFIGKSPQRPPAYSAKRVAGRRAHQLARQGRPLELEPVEITVHEMLLLAWEPPKLRFEVVVSTGTYVRSLARDIGTALGMGAHLAELRREAIGPHRADDALGLEMLGPKVELMEPGALVPDLPQVELDGGELEGVRHGRLVLRSGTEGFAALVSDSRLVAIAEAAGDGWQPRVVLDPA